MILSLPYQPILASFRQTPLGRLAHWAGCGIYMRVLGAPSLTSEREHALLRRLCAGMVGGCRMLEIGSWMGASAVVLGAEARAQTYFRSAEYTASLVPFMRAHAKALQAADGSLIPRMFELIDPTLMSASEYTALLEHLLLAVKSTQANARFLGVVGSELNKMK